MDNLEKQEKEFIDKLQLVREDYIKTKEQLAISIRKDLVIVQLKEILKNTTDIFNFKASLEEYVKELEESLNGNRTNN